MLKFSKGFHQNKIVKRNSKPKILKNDANMM